MWLLQAQLACAVGLAAAAELDRPQYICAPSPGVPWQNPKQEVVYLQVVARGCTDQTAVGDVATAATHTPATLKADDAEGVVQQQTDGHTIARTVEIAPGVAMPFANLGGSDGAQSNYTFGLAAGFRGFDTALSYTRVRG